MKIETKFDLGDYVYMFLEERITEVMVARIETTSETNTFMNDETQVKYTVRISYNKFEPAYGECMFKTMDELCEDLKGNVKEY